MTAYYNENDKFAAAWLRQLVAAKLICAGDVDERSIKEVTKKDLRGYTQCHFFAGIGVWSYALRNAGWPDDSPVWTGSCPCQGFSASGQRRGFSDKRHLWPAWFRLAEQLQPDVILGEQVSSRDGLAWFDIVSADLENAGYAIGSLDTCAASVGAPHIRNRIYFVAEREREGCEFVEAPRLHGERASGDDADRCQSSFDFMADTKRGAAERFGFSMGRTARGSEEEGIQPQRIRIDSGDGRAVDRMADTELRRPESGQGTQRRIFQSDAHRARGVADSESQCDGTWSRRTRRGSESADGGGVGYAEFRDGSARASRSVEEQSASVIEGIGSAGALGHASGTGREGSEFSAAHGGGEGAGAQGPVAESTRTFWSDAKYIYCRDGKYRIVPAEPALQPLAPRTAGRVGMLRGAGNALCAPQAQAFIEAYLSLKRRA